MKNSDLIILQKIIQYCLEIQSTLERFDTSIEEFKQDFVVRNAVAMCILQIGELVIKLSDGFKSQNSVVPWREIKGMRNIAAHNYGEIDVDILWETIYEDIPELRQFCEIKLSERKGNE